MWNIVRTISVSYLLLLSVSALWISKINSVILDVVICLLVCTANSLCYVAHFCIFVHFLRLKRICESSTEEYVLLFTVAV